MSIGIRVNKDKIGHLMVYLASQITPIYHPKLLRLLYLIDAAAVKENGVPVTWLDYHVWEYGPVAPEASDLHHKENHFSEYVAAQTDHSGTKIIPLKEFYDGEFSDQELGIIDSVIETYGNMTSQELIDIICQEGSLWHATRKENNVDFGSIQDEASSCVLDLTRLIKDETKLSNYNGAKEMMHFKLPHKE